MGKHAQLIVGPAGSGKSTYCSQIQKHAETAMRRTLHVVNLDPAADFLPYEPALDIRELITLEDVMQELDLGPNGGLVYCLEYLLENMDWFEEGLQDFAEDYLLLDCPGQIELYSHLPVMRVLVQHLQRSGYQVASVALMDALLVTDVSRFISGALMCLSFMVQLELPHVNVLSKCDLVPEKQVLEKYLDADVDILLAEINYGDKVGSIIDSLEKPNNYRRSEEELQRKRADKFVRLHEAVAQLLTQYSMVSFVALDLSDDESINLILQHVDNAISYGDDVEPKEPEDQVDFDQIAESIMPS